MNLTSNVLKAYAHRHAVGGARMGVTSHRLYTCNYGIAIPQILNAEHDGDAALSVMALLTSDITGANAPIAETDSESLASSFTLPRRWTIGPVVIAGVTIASVKSISLDFGLNVAGEAADGDIWDSHCSLISGQPILTIRGVDVEWLKAANIPLAGKAGVQIGAPDTYFYLKHRLKGGAYVPDGTATHLRFDMAGYCYIDDAFDASPGGPAEVSLIVRPYDDGTNDIITMDTSVAIT